MSDELGRKARAVVKDLYYCNDETLDSPSKKVDIQHVLDALKEAKQAGYAQARKEFKSKWPSEVETCEQFMCPKTVGAGAHAVSVYRWLRQKLFGEGE